MATKYDASLHRFSECISFILHESGLIKVETHFKNVTNTNGTDRKKREE